LYLLTGILFFILNRLFMNMYVSNLSFHTNEEALKELFAAYGTVTSAKVITDRESGQSRGFGFVEMNVEAEAEAAMKGLHSKEIEGRAMSVSVAKEKPRSDNKRW
jgi:RNA recognition motif-containing protein